MTGTGIGKFAGAIGQDAAGRALLKSGSGTLVLAAANTYTGSTTINSGLSRVDGNLASGTGAVIVKNTGTLGGTGTVGAVQVQSGATLNPGASPGQLKTGNVQYLAGAIAAFELNGTTAGSGYDQVKTTGTVSLGGSTLNLVLGFTPTIGTSFTLIDNDGTDAVSGTFSGLAEGATFGLSGMTFQISYVGGTGNDVVLTRIA